MPAAHCPAASDVRLGSFSRLARRPFRFVLERRYGLDTSQFGYDPAAAEAGAPPPPPLIPREDAGAAQRRCAVM